jgi:triphosphatase
MTDEPQEIELKFRPPAGRAEAIFAALAPSQCKIWQLTAIYFDTPRHALAKAGLTLRVRHDGETWVQTLKSDQAAGGGLGRGEWETTVPGATPDARLLRGTPARKVLAKTRRLVAQFTVKVERRVAVRQVGTLAVEVSFDHGEVSANGQTAAVHEIELELKAGTPKALLTFAAHERQIHGLALSFATKAARGNELLQKTRSRALRFRPPRLSPEMTTAHAFQAVARACLEQIIGNAERLAETPGPEVIHQMRVGARRLRSALSTFGKVVSDRRLTAVKAELRWLTGELDPARNLDVLLAGAYRRAAQRKADKLGLADLGRRLRIARTAAYARARSAAESERLRAFAMDTLVWIETGAWTAARARRKARGRPLKTFAAKALQKRRDKVVGVGAKLAALSREDRHRLRIDAKKLRYAADVLAPMSPYVGRAGRFIDALKDLQDRLGDLNDIATGESLAHDLVASPEISGAADWAAGRLIGVETAREAALLSQAGAAIKALKDVRPFWQET